MKSNEELWREVRRVQAKVEKEITEEERKKSNWHTGTPTEEGWYLCWVSFPKEIAPMVYKWKNNKFMLTDIWESDDDILMWQKIEPYKEKEDDERTSN